MYAEQAAILVNLMQKVKLENVEVMVIRVVEFLSRGYKIGRIFAIKSTYPREIIEI